MLTAEDAKYRQEISPKLTLRELIAQSFWVHPARVAGADDVLGQAFTVVYRVPTNDEFSPNPVLQHVLRSTFGIEGTVVNSEADVYVLAVAADGPHGIKRVMTPGCEEHLSGLAPCLTGEGFTLDRLAWILEHFLDKPVVNETRLVGAYNFSIDWNTTSPSTATVIRTVYDQLGLTLTLDKRATRIVRVRPVGPGDVNN